MPESHDHQAAIHAQELSMISLRFPEAVPGSVANQIEQISEELKEVLRRKGIADLDTISIGFSLRLPEMDGNEEQQPAASRQDRTPRKTKPIAANNDRVVGDGNY